MGNSRHRRRSRSRHRSDSEDRDRRRRSDRRSNSRHRPHKQSQEQEMRKKQERLAKARLMLLHEESEEPAEALVPMEVEDDKEIDLEDPAEMVVEQVVTGDDTLDEYLRSIESEVVPQDGTLFAPQQVTAIGLEEIGPAEQPEEDEDYYASFLAAFKPQPGPVAEDKSKPEVCYEEDDDIIWDRLQLDEDDEASSRVVRPRQQHKAQEKREIPLPPAGFTYEPIRKNLYVQSPELARLTYEETISLREEMAGIKVRGKRCPAPILNWYQCGLSDKILKALERKGFKGPFPIQSQVSAS